MHKVMKKKRWKLSKQPSQFKFLQGKILSPSDYASSVLALRAPTMRHFLLKKCLLQRRITSAMPMQLARKM